MEGGEKKPSLFFLSSFLLSLCVILLGTFILFSSVLPLIVTHLLSLFFALFFLPQADFSGGESFEGVNICPSSLGPVQTEMRVALKMRHF